MKMSWRTEVCGVGCRWAQVDERVRYDPPWTEECSKHWEDKSPWVAVEWGKISPFGGAYWYSPKPIKAVPK